MFPYAAIQFLSFEVYKKALNNRFAHQGSVNHELKFIAGSAASVTSASITYPLDLVRARLAFRVAIGQTATIDGVKVPTSILGTILYVFRYEG